MAAHAASDAAKQLPKEGSTLLLVAAVWGVGAEIVETLLQLREPRVVHLGDAESYARGRRDGIKAAYERGFEDGGNAAMGREVEGPPE